MEDHRIPCCATGASVDSSPLRWFLRQVHSVVTGARCPRCEQCEKRRRSRTEQGRTAIQREPERGCSSGRARRVGGPQPLCTDLPAPVQSHWNGHCGGCHWVLRPMVAAGRCSWLRPVAERLQPLHDRYANARIPPLGAGCTSAEPHDESAARDKRPSARSARAEEGRADRVISESADEGGQRRRGVGGRRPSLFSVMTGVRP